MNRVSRRLRLLMVAGLATLAIAAPLGVSAATGGGGGPGGATVSVVSARFVNKLVVSVTVEMSCQPFAELDWDGTPTGNTTTAGSIAGSVDLLQAQGRTIAHGNGRLNPETQQGSLVTCDGTAFRMDVPVVAQDYPLRRGDAVVFVDVAIYPVVTCCNQWTYDGITAGPIAVKIR